jgi:Uma2 family endonuclease
MQQVTRDVRPVSQRVRRWTRVRLRNMEPIKPYKKVATYDDLLAAPEHKVAEIIDGDLYLSPRPAPPHASAAFRLTVALGRSFDEGGGGPGGWRFLPEPELHLGPDTVVPDLAAWRPERFPVVAPGPAYILVAPDWLCEILSPSTESLDRRKKLRIYAREAVRHVWLIDPLDRIIENHRFESGRLVLIDTYRNQETVQAEPFEAIPLELSRLWS